MAASGGLILLWILGINTSVAVWVGFIALFGVAVDDGVVLMSFIKSEHKRIGPKNSEELFNVIVEAGSRRIRPLLMTTATTVIALLPVMWSSGTGAEVMRPMAIPILGGMTIELITLFIVPIIYSFVEQRRIEQENNYV